MKTRSNRIAEKGEIAQEGERLVIIGMGGVGGLAAQGDCRGGNLLAHHQMAKDTRVLQISQKVPREMTQKQLANERAVATLIKTLRDDLIKAVETGLLPMACIIAFRESSMEEYEAIRFIARWTRDCPSGLDKALDEVLHKWLEQNYDECIPVSEMPSHKH